MGAPPLPDWAHWRTSVDAQPYSLGVEEEVMLIDRSDWSLAQVADAVLPSLSPALRRHVTPETHAGALELATGINVRPGDAIAELAQLRMELAAQLGDQGLAVAAGGTHPLADRDETIVSTGERYQSLYASMREIARREPTFALHVHVGVPDAETAVDLANRLRAHAPLLLALSANSPFWHGRDSGLASSRTALFQAFPRTGLPRRFDDYADWVGAIAPLIDAGAIPDPTFLWWDVRVQPRLGTVEMRIMDAQSSLRDVAGLVGLTQALARLELEERFAPEGLLDAPEVLAENRFLAARDGMEARFVMPGSRGSVPAREWCRDVVAAARPHAERLGAFHELELAEALCEASPAERQRRVARGAQGLGGVVASAVEVFVREPTTIRSGGAGRPTALAGPSR
jgi:carboxylate-amine ligase